CTDGKRIEDDQALQHVTDEIFANVLLRGRRETGAARTVLRNACQSNACGEPLKPAFTTSS
ncbi:MAG: hypothetical protein ACK4N5_18945, partial [Myxococcales bacterium]